MPVNSQIILFAIQAAVRLEGQVRQAQIDRIKNHSINLLLPQFDGNANVKSAVRWFTRSGASNISDDLELVQLVEKAEVDRGGLSDAERERIIKEYTKIRNLDEGHVKFGGGIPKEHIFALTEVKQWEDGKNPTPSPLQRIGGALIEIGVDYFKTTPYLANANSPQAKMLCSFLDAVDEIDFAEGQLQDIASKMMFATLETIDHGTGFLSGDDKSGKLLKSLAKGIISDVNNFVKTEGAGNLFKQEQAKQWGQIVFKSVLSTAGEAVLNNPNKFLGDSGGAEMVQSVGNCLVKGIMEDIDAGDGAIVSLKNVFTADTLDKVTKASFEVLAEHPEWYAVDNEGVKNILTQLTKEIANYPNQLGMDMLPDLVTMILTQTSGNLELIYQGDPSKPANNLLIKATTIVLGTLQDAVPVEAGQPWKPIFTKSNTIALVDVVLQEVVSKPEWILTEAEDASPVLKDVLSATFQSLQGVSVGNMSTTTKMNIVKSAINAVTIQQGLLEKMNVNGEQKQLLNYCIDIVLDLAFSQKANAKAKWALASGQALDMMIDGVLHRIAVEGASDDVLNLTKEFLNGEIDSLTEGQGLNVKALAAKLKSGDSLQSLMQNSINAATRISATLLAENPGLIKIENAGIKNMINHFVDMLATFPDDFSKAALPSLAQMVILNASSNIGTIIGDNTDNPAKNLLVMTSQTVLSQLASTDKNGKVTIKYTSEQALGLVNTTIQYVVNNPSWILDATGQKSPILEQALSATMKALEGVDVMKMTNDTKINIIQSAIGAVALRQDLLNKVNIDGQETELLSGGIEIALSMAFGEKASAEAKWALMSGDVMDELINGVLHRIAKEGGSEDVLGLTKEFLAGELQDLTDGQPLNIQSVISKLKSEEGLQSLMQNSINAATRISATLLTENPGLIKIENAGVKNMINHFVDMLATFPDDFSKAALPSLAQMVILNASSNIGTIIGDNTDNPAKNLLVMTSETVLGQLASTDENGKVTIKYTSEQALGLVNTTIQYVVNNPSWILDATGEKSPILEQALSVTMKAIEGVDVMKMTNDTKINILQSAIGAVALRQDLLNKVNIDGKETELLSGGIEMALSMAFGEKASAQAKWALMSGDVMDELINGVLHRIAKEGGSEDVLGLTKEFLAGELQDLTDGQPLNIQSVISKLKSEEGLQSLMKNSLNAATRITATLLTDNADKIKLGNDNVKGLVVQIMDSLANFQSDFSLSVLPDLAMMLAIDTSDNLGTLIGGDGEDPGTNLLVMATQTVMKTISSTDENGKVSITFTPDQTLNLVDTVIQQVISKPQWVTSAAGKASPLLEDALTATMAALDGASILSLSNESKINIMKAAVSAVGMNKSFMNKVGVESDFAMKVALDMVFKAAQGEFKVGEGEDLTGVITGVLTETAKENIQWALSDNATLESLSGAVLGRLASEGTSEETLKMTNQLLANSISKIGNGESFSVSDLVAQLESPEKLADIIAQWTEV